MGFEICNGQHRTGFRHTISRIDIDAEIKTGLAKFSGKRSPSDDDLPAGKIDILYRRAVEQHEQNGRHAMGESDPLFCNQSQQLTGLVPAGIDLFASHQSHHIGYSPGVHMKHGRQRHIHIPGSDRGMKVGYTEGSHGPVCVKDKLTMTEVDPFGKTGGPGGVKGGGHGVFIKVRKIKRRIALCQQILEFAVDLQVGLGKYFFIGE